MKENKLILKKKTVIRPVVDFTADKMIISRQLNHPINYWHMENPSNYNSTPNGNTLHRHKENNKFIKQN